MGKDIAQDTAFYFFFELLPPSPGGSYFSFHILEARCQLPYLVCAICVCSCPKTTGVCAVMQEDRQILSSRTSNACFAMGTDSKPGFKPNWTASMIFKDKNLAQQQTYQVFPSVLLPDVSASR